MKVFKRYLALFFSLMLAAMGVSLTMKAAVGVSAFDAFTQTLAYSYDLRVGDMVMLLQAFFLFLQLIILRRKASWTILLQLPLAIILGQFINFFFYRFFNNMVIPSYSVQLLLFLFGQIWVSFFITTIISLDLVTMPVESFSLLLSKRTSYRFGTIRQIIDGLLIGLAFLLTYIYSVPMTVREGTIISALTFGPLVTFFMPKVKRYFMKWNLIDEF